MATVTIKNLKKRFEKVVAVNDVSLEARDGEFLALLGPSGCGKTTILRCIAGLETADEGEIYIGDKLVNELPPKARDTAMVFQNYALYPHMKIFDNLAFPLKMQKVPKDEIEKRVKETAKLLRIDKLLDRKPKQLSGGEAQRVALGRAIVRNPKVFLMDEPLSNLDAKLRIYMRAELKRLQKELEVTTIFVTHDQVEAMTMADEVAIMNSGMLQQLGNSNEIYSHPSNMFVGGFIGNPPMNFTSCTLGEKNELWSLKASAFAVPISKDIYEMIEKGATSSELVLGVRPEDIFLGKKKGPKDLVEAEVYVVEPLGSENLVSLNVGDDIVKVKTAPDFSLGIGEKVWMGLNQEKIHVFDKKTEEIIM